MQAMDLLLNYQTDMTHQFWSDRYQGINRANALLEGVANMELEDNERNQVIGEAKFMRAFFYYELASQYGLFLWYSLRKKLSLLNLQLQLCGDRF